MKRAMCWILFLMLTMPVLALATQGSATIGGIAFLDANGDGLMDAGERTLSDVEVTLIHVDGGTETIAGNTQTQGDGVFLFSQVPAGSYYLKALLPDGFYFAPPAEGGSIMLPASGQSSHSAELHIEDGQHMDTPIGLIRQPSYITVYAFGDLNGNGGRMSNEPKLRNVLLEVLFDTPQGTHVVGTAITDKEGIATIRDLTPGTYRLRATLPEPYVVGTLGLKINPFYNTILPSQGNIGVSAPFELPFKGSVGLGVGGVETGKAEGSIWLDANMNGRRDADEAGFAGATIELTHTTLGVARTTISGADGAYAFSSLQEGTYRLTVTLPEDVMFTLPGDSLFSHGNSRTGAADTQVEIRKTTTLQPVGVMPNTSMVLNAFHDQNVNGIREDGEPMFAGAKVTVSAGGRQVAEASTDASGVALFPLLRGGELSVEVTLPDGQVFTVDGGEGGNRFVSARASSLVSTPFLLPHGTMGTLWAGVTLPASIAGTLYDDINMNSRLDDGEGPLAGFAVQAVNAAGDVVAETLTDDAGAYTISGLIPGSYRVRVPLVAPFIFSQAVEESANNAFLEQSPANGQTAPVELTAAQTLTGVDGALFRSAVVTGSVLLGDTSDGYSGKRGGLPGVRVVLLYEDGTEVSEYTHADTDNEGAFLLKGALPGIYRLAYRLPEGALFSSPYIDQIEYITDAFPLEAGASKQADSVFAVRTGSMAGVVYVDNNDNGLLDETDTRYADAQIAMTMDELGLVTRVTSSEDGSYRIDGLRPGDYTMDITLGEGMLIAFSETSPATPVLANIAASTLTIAMGEAKNGRDIAVVPSRALTGRVFYDNDLSQSDTNGDTPYTGLEVKFRHVLSGIEFSAVSEADGSFTLPTLFPGAYTMVLTLPGDMELYAPTGGQAEGTNWSAGITVAGEGDPTVVPVGLVQFGALSGQVWNMGGTMDDVGGLPVMLYRQGEATAIAATTTDANGSYRFERLYPGTYSIGITLGEGYRFARTIDTAERGSLITSDGSAVHGVAGHSAAFVLAMGEHRADGDVGMGKMGQLGDFAWLDMDGDGMQDMGEPGVPGITIRLYQHGQLAAETTTDPYGRYLFPELHPGIYTLQAAMPAELTATKQQTEFPLVASILPQAQGSTALAENISVPSGGRNLNADLGFTLRDGKTLPESMRELPTKDWTPYVNVTPTR